METFLKIISENIELLLLKKLLEGVHLVHLL